MKKLERGRFAELWGDGSGKTVRLTTSELALYIEGCTLVGKKSLSPAPITRNELAVHDRGCDSLATCSTLSMRETSSGCARWRCCRSPSSNASSPCWRASAELQKLKGGEDELQLALKLLEDAQREVAKADQAASRGRPGAGGDAKDRAPQTGHGPTDQLALERVPLRCELDEADRVCPSCEGHLEPLKGQAERSG